MREILFRGQTRRKGEKVRMDGSPVQSNWVYGGVFHQSDRGGDFSIIYTYDPIEKRMVYADTVGQYTGIVDKNGKKIFEGDILQFTNNDNEQTNYEVIWFGNRWAVVMCGTNSSDDLDIFFCEHSEIIGNIYDNPELLENITK